MRTLDFSWFEALDPDSYQLWEDPDTQGSLWCPDPDCSNYYRYLERPILRRCCGRVSSRCNYGCGDKRDNLRIKGRIFSGTAAMSAEQERIAYASRFTRAKRAPVKSRPAKLAKRTGVASKPVPSTPASTRTKSRPAKPGKRTGVASKPVPSTSAPTRTSSVPLCSGSGSAACSMNMVMCSTLAACNCKAPQPVPGRPVWWGGGRKLGNGFCGKWRQRFQFLLGRRNLSAADAARVAWGERTEK